MGVKVSYSTEVEFVPCANCHVTFGLTAEYITARRKDGQHFYCPNGHGNSYRDNENDRIRRERDLLKQKAAQKDDEIARLREQRVAAERQVAASKGQVTRLRNRAGAGTCPCCNRTFRQMALHMKNKHPTFRAEQVA
jgi:hypothetical protein